MIPKNWERRKFLAGTGSATLAAGLYSASAHAQTTAQAPEKIGALRLHLGGILAHAPLLAAWSLIQSGS